MISDNCDQLQGIHTFVLVCTKLQMCLGTIYSRPNILYTNSYRMLVKNLLSNIFTTFIFIGCAVFVIMRGQKCLQKFLEKPQKAQISYEFSGNMNFPAITICETDEDAYDNNILKQCQLNQEDYSKIGPWSGSGDSFCENPKELHNKVSFKPKGLYIEWIIIETFTKDHEFRSNNINEVLKWENIVPYGFKYKCFRIIIPKKIVIEGIHSIKLYSKPFYKLHVHQNGLLQSDMAGSSPKAYYNEFSKMTVTHEILELLDYAGDECINNKDYDYGMCRQNYIFQVL